MPTSRYYVTFFCISLIISTVLSVEHLKKSNVIPSNTKLTQKEIIPTLITELISRTQQASSKKNASPLKTTKPSNSTSSKKKRFGYFPQSPIANFYHPIQPQANIYTTITWKPRINTVRLEYVDHLLSTSNNLNPQNPLQIGYVVQCLSEILGINQIMLNTPRNNQLLSQLLQATRLQQWPRSWVERASPYKFNLFLIALLGDVIEEIPRRNQFGIEVPSIMFFMTQIYPQKLPLEDVDTEVLEGVENLLKSNNANQYMSNLVQLLLLMSKKLEQIETIDPAAIDVIVASVYRFNVIRNNDKVVQLFMSVRYQAQQQILTDDQEFWDIIDIFIKNPITRLLIDHNLLYFVESQINERTLLSRVPIDEIFLAIQKLSSRNKQDYDNPIFAAIAVQKILELVGVYNRNAYNPQIQAVLKQIGYYLGIHHWPIPWPVDRVQVPKNVRAPLINMLMNGLRFNGRVDMNAIEVRIQHLQQIFGDTPDQFDSENQEFIFLINDMLRKRNDDESEQANTVIRFLLKITNKLRRSAILQRPLNIDPIMLEIVLRIIKQSGQTPRNSRVIILVRQLQGILRSTNRLISPQFEEKLVPTWLKEIIRIVGNKNVITMKPIDQDLLGDTVRLINNVRPELKSHLKIPEYLYPNQLPKSTRDFLIGLVHDLQFHGKIDRKKLASVVQYLLHLIGINRYNIKNEENAYYLKHILNLMQLQHWPSPWQRNFVIEQGTNVAYLIDILCQILRNHAMSEADFIQLRDLVLVLWYRNYKSSGILPDGHPDIVRFMLDIIRTIQRPSSDEIARVTGSVVVPLLLEYIKTGPKQPMDLSILYNLRKYFRTLSARNRLTFLGITARLIDTTRNFHTDNNAYLQQKLIFRLIVEILNQYGTLITKFIRPEIIQEVFQVLNMKAHQTAILFTQKSYELFLNVLNYIPKHLVDGVPKLYEVLQFIGGKFSEFNPRVSIVVTQGSILSQTNLVAVLQHHQQLIGF